MIFGKHKQNQFGLTLMMCILSAVLAISCARERGTSNASQSEINSENQTKSTEMGSLFEQPEFTEAVLEQNNDIIPIAENLLSLYSAKERLSVTLTCIPDSLAYPMIIVDGYKLTGLPREGKLIINNPEAELRNQCESKINKINDHLKLAKLGIQYNSKDYELKILNPIRVTTDFINSLVTTPIQNINISCTSNNSYIEIDGNPVTFSGKLYQKNLITSENDYILFIDIDRKSIQNLFNHCDNKKLFAMSDELTYKNIYFINDPLQKSDEENFTIKQ